MMLSNQVAAAIQQLQRRAVRAEGRSFYQTELCELAMSELLRHPGRDGESHLLVKRALANARKSIRRRRRIASIEHVDSTGHAEREHDVMPLQRRAEFTSFLEWLPLPDSDRSLLGLLVHDHDAEFVSRKLGWSLPQSHTRISRVRARVRAFREAA